MQSSSEKFIGQQRTVGDNDIQGRAMSQFVAQCSRGIKCDLNCRKNSVLFSYSCMLPKLVFMSVIVLMHRNNRRTSIQFFCCLEYPRCVTKVTSTRNRHYIPDLS